MKHFEYFSETPKCLEISLDDLKAILLSKDAVSPDHNLLVNVATRWAQYNTSSSSMEARKLDFNKLISVISFHKICPDYLAYLENKLVQNVSTPNHGTPAVKSVDSTSKQQSLHLYIKNTRDNFSRTNVFTLQRHMSKYSWHFSCTGSRVKRFIRAGIKQ